MPLRGKELLKKIQKRSPIQPGMLVNVINGSEQPLVMALVHRLSPSCRFDEDYPDAETHIFYICQPLNGTPEFCDYVCNMEQVS